jgi:hypothetical protein
MYREAVTALMYQTLEKSPVLPDKTNIIPNGLPEYQLEELRMNLRHLLHQPTMMFM